MKTIYTTSNFDFQIEVKQSKNSRFTVIYGQQIKRGLSYEEAAKELGECIFHALACQGKLEDDTN
jgi:hypothetical protein